MDNVTTFEATEPAPLVRERIRDLLGQAGNHITLKTLSKGINYAPGTLSDWLAGKYGGNAANVDRAAAAWLNRYEARQALPQKPAFAPTSIAMEVAGALETAHIQGDMAMIVGPSGVGKTEGCLDYIRSATRAILISAGVQLGNPRSVCRMLCDALKLDSTLSTRDMIYSLREELRGTRSLIIVDEADDLTPSSVDMLRQLHDNTADEEGVCCAVAFVGVGRLFQRVKNADRFAQVYNRIGVFLPLGRITPEDAQAILAGAPADVVQAAFEEASGDARKLVKGWLRSLLVQGGGTLTRESVRLGYQLLVA